MREMVPHESLELLFLWDVFLGWELVEEVLEELQENGVEFNGEFLDAGDGDLHLIVFVSIL